MKKILLFLLLLPSILFAQWPYAGTPAASSVTGTEKVPIQQGGAAKTATVNQIIALAGGGSVDTLKIPYFYNGRQLGYVYFNGTKWIAKTGTAAQFMKADGSFDNNTYLTTVAAASTYAPKLSGTGFVVQSGTTTSYDTNHYIPLGGTNSLGGNILSVTDADGVPVGFGQVNTSLTKYAAVSMVKSGNQRQLYVEIADSSNSSGMNIFGEPSPSVNMTVRGKFFRIRGDSATFVSSSPIKYNSGIRSYLTSASDRNLVLINKGYADSTYGGVPFTADSSLRLNGANKLMTNAPTKIVSGTSYTLTDADFGYSIHFTNAALVTLTLPTSGLRKNFIAYPLAKTNKVLMVTSGTFERSNDTIVGPRGYATVHNYTGTTWLATGALGIPTSGGGGSGGVNTGAANTLAYYPSSGTTVDDLPAITPNRVLLSNASGLPIASSVTNTTLGFIDPTSSIQTQLDSKLSTSVAASTYYPLVGGTITGIGGNGFFGSLNQSSAPSQYASGSNGAKIYIDTAGRIATVRRRGNSQFTINQDDLQPVIGTIINDNFDRATPVYGNSGSNISTSIVSNKLRIANATGNTGANNYVNLAKTTWLPDFEQSITINPISDGNGIGIGFLSWVAKLDMNTAGNRGTLTINSRDLTTGVLTQAQTSTTNALSYTNGDQLVFTFKVEGWRIIATVDNYTTFGRVQITHNGSLALGAVPVPRPKPLEIFSFGGTQDVSNYRLYSSVRKFQKIAMVGNSNMVGSASGSDYNRIAASYVINDIGNGFIYAASGANMKEFKAQLNELISLRPEYVSIHLGTNDAGQGVSTASFLATLDSTLDILTRNGITPILNTIIPGAAVTAYNTGISARSTKYIVVDQSAAFLAVANIANIYATDNIHMLETGHNLWANTFLNSTKFLLRKPYMQNWLLTRNHTGFASDPLEPVFTVTNTSTVQGDGSNSTNRAKMAVIANNGGIQGLMQVNYNSNTDGTVFTVGTATNHAFTFTQNGVRKMRLAPTTGNLLIGDINAADRAVVTLEKNYVGPVSSTFEPIMYISNSSTTKGDGGGSTSRANVTVASGNNVVVGYVQSEYNTNFERMKVGTTSNHPVTFMQGNTDVMTISTLKRVGIGTSTPQSRLNSTGSIMLDSLKGTINRQVRVRPNGLLYDTLIGSGGGTSYTFSTGLTNTANTITANLATGISGGQSVIGGTASGNNLTLSSTTNATKGSILMGTSAYDETNNRYGIGTTAPTHSLTYASTGTGMAMYNTSDQTTNYERARQFWSANTYTIATENGGTGINRAMSLVGSGGTTKMYIAPAQFTGGNSLYSEITSVTGSTKSARIYNESNSAYAHTDFIAEDLTSPSSKRTFRIGDGASFTFLGDMATYDADYTTALNSSTYGLLPKNYADTRYAQKLTNTAVLDFPSTSAMSVSDLTITVTGAVLGDAVSIGVPNGSTVASGSFSAWVSATNTVTIRYANNDGLTPRDPASGTFKAMILR